ncbi:MAG: autotransporter adhesin family protein, partial [Lachnospiraceae bacterium]|nr:autotransporter adhesin family protein [Ruminococcus sp.]MCM1277287.1 autotransporter adhesin family protein [Lachnospiraceae bacterium]
MKTGFKRLIAAVSAFAVIAASVVFDVPQRLAAVAADSSNCTGNHSGWTATSTLPTTSGKYYLTSDVNVAENVWLKNADITLCLNGHTVRYTGSSSSNALVFTVPDASTSLTLCDCSGGKTGTLTGGCGHGLGGAVYIGSGATFTLNGGNISGNLTRLGGGVFVDSGGTFIMNGGSISNNTSTEDGGGVRVNSGAIFTMNGGSISGNTARRGGGVDNNGTITMNGGTISGNKAVGADGTSADGGGMFHFSGTFTMNGGSILNNSSSEGGYGGGVYYGSGTFTIDGKVEIIGNTVGGQSKNVDIRNPITIGPNFATDKPIGVIRRNISCDRPLAVTNEADEVILSKFTSEADEGYYLAYEDGAVKMLVPHRFTKTEEKAATCLEDGNIEYWYCTACRNYYSDGEGKNKISETKTVTAKTGHTLTTIAGKAATCTETGVKTCYHCSVCDKYFSSSSKYGTSETTPGEVTNALGHNYRNAPWSMDDTHHWHECRRKSGGVACGVIDEKIAHTWSVTVTKEPTCTEKGAKELTCEVCEYTKTEDIAATGHSWNSGTVTTAATCTAKGVKTYTCTVCGQTKTEDIAAKSHTEVIDKAVAATCTTDGKTEGKHCSVCDTVITAQTTVAATGHDWDNGTVTKEPTETSEGVKTFTCENCKETKTETIPKLDHVHSLTHHEKVDADCVNTGTVEYWHCEKCGKNYGDAAAKNQLADLTIAAKGHTEVADAAKAPTCTETGLTEGSHCSVCDKVLTEQQTVPALGHDWNDGVVTTAPTCTEKGVRMFTCKRDNCGETKTEDVDTTGHTEVTDAAKAPTCTETGLTEGSHCSVCGTVIKAQTIVPKTGHAWNDG